MPFGLNSVLFSLYMLLMMLIPLAVVGLVVYYASAAGARRAVAGFQLGNNPGRPRPEDNPPPNPAPEGENP